MVSFCILLLAFGVLLSGFSFRAPGIAFCFLLRAFGVLLCRFSFRALAVGFCFLLLAFGYLLPACFRMLFWKGEIAF